MDIRTLLKNVDREVFWDSYEFNIRAYKNSICYTTNTVDGSNLRDAIPYDIRLNKKFLSLRITQNGFVALVRNIENVVFSEVDEDIYDFISRINGMVKNGFV